ncbi:MAG: VIT1/CCC1 transporter family protein [Candidatus Bilamarchaeum sp.]
MGKENHNGLGLLIRNVILGGQDGLVNVLGIILGVATATKSTDLVLLSGLAATFAESLSMAAVAYTSTRAEAEHYYSVVNSEKNQIEKRPNDARSDIEKIYSAKGLSGSLLTNVVDKICSNKKVWLDTMVREELHLEDPSESMSPTMQGVVVGGSAMVGSLVPIAPFFFLPVELSITVSLIISLITLFAVGAYKSKITSGRWIKGGFELMIIGGLAALTGWLVGLFFNVSV